MREQIVAHRAAPPSEPANRWFLRPSATGRMARSTELLSSSMLASSRKGERAGHRGSGARVTTRRGPPAVPRNAAELLFEPGLHGRDQRSRLDIAHVCAVLGRAAPD